jgi:hypothetical protein
MSGAALVLAEVTVRPMAVADVDGADRVMRIAFARSSDLASRRPRSGRRRLCGRALPRTPIARGWRRWTVVAGVNLARHDAYRRMLALGYRPRMQGVIMQRPNDPGYCRPDVLVIDDLR